jgi:hypothetical protein
MNALTFGGTDLVRLGDVGDGSKKSISPFGSLEILVTNNVSDQSSRGFKIAIRIKGCWRSLATLQRPCRIRSYLISAYNHELVLREAIRDAPTGMSPALT